jgi:hypothetical protein
MEGITGMKTCPTCGAIIRTVGARPVGRKRRHTVDDLVDCLGAHRWTTGEFQRRAKATLDVSKSTFFRLLDRGRQDWRFRQGADCRWRMVPNSQNSAEASDSLPDELGEQADKALHE